jgi:hypothetical protein
MMKPKIEFLPARAYGAEGVRLASFALVALDAVLAHVADE